MKTTARKIKFKFKFLLKEIIFISLYVFVMLFIIVGGGFAYLIMKTPLGDSLYTRNIAQTSIVYDRTGTHVLYEIYGEENRMIISHNEIPDTIRVATVATEDENFYSHHGLDFLAIIRALKKDIETMTFSQGGSTITQQLARNAFLNRDKTIRRKIMEAVYAIKIERKYSKDDILDAYLNQVPYGSNAYGIETAAEAYFRKPAKELTLDESAMLAALTKAPTSYSPYGKYKDALVKRQKEILSQIEELNLENSQTVGDALKVNTMAKVVPFVQSIKAPHFVFYVRDQLEKQYGKKIVQEGGLKIYTTLDYDKQKLAEQILQSSDTTLNNYGASNAGLVALDPKSGQILAMAGSKNYFDQEIDGEVNVTLSPRQPGSSFKPIAYAKAFEEGYQPETLVLDAPTNFGPDGSGENYVPQNYDGKFHGVLSMRQTLAMSLNIPAIKTLRAVGIKEVIEMAHRLGITTLNDPDRYGLSLVIGGGEVTLLDETSAFSVFANDGKQNPADPILKIVDNKGKVIKANESPNLLVLDPQIARKINSILSDNSARAPIFGRNNKLYISGKTVAAKTGTTQEFRDAWTVGYTPDIAVGVWAGNNDNQPMHAGADGSIVAAPIWNKFMSQVLQTYPNVGFVAYEKSNTKSPSVSQLASASQKFDITYYKINSDKKISLNKAKKLDPKKVRMQIEIVAADGNATTLKLLGSNFGLGLNSGVPAF